jgi:hypothetical protein
VDLDVPPSHHDRRDFSGKDLHSRVGNLLKRSR